MDNKIRMRMFSNLIVRFIHSAYAQKNKKRLLFIKFVLIYLKKNYNLTGKINAASIAEMVYDLTIDRYRSATRVCED